MNMIRKALACLMTISILICMAGCGHEHSMAERTLKEKTCTTDGEIEYYCTGCDYKYTEKIEASHNYEKTVIKESTCTTRGEAKYVCKDCGDTYNEELPLSSHTYENKYCTVCGAKKIGIITTPFIPKSFNYGAADIIRTTCRITDVKAEIN